EICSSFVENFYDDSAEFILQKYFHDNTWKETDEELANITLEILDSLNDIWKNPAFEIQFAESQTENTELKKEKAEFLAKEAGFMTRIMELEQNAEKARLRDTELNTRIIELER
ncbi:15408_t:CDS:2, partial [Racocetra fulgida]